MKCFNFVTFNEMIYLFVVKKIKTSNMFFFLWEGVGGELYYAAAIVNFTGG